MGGYCAISSLARLLSVFSSASDVRVSIASKIDRKRSRVMAMGAAAFFSARVAERRSALAKYWSRRCSSVVAAEFEDELSSLADIRRIGEVILDDEDTDLRLTTWWRWHFENVAVERPPLECDIGTNPSTLETCDVEADSNNAKAAAVVR